MTPTHCLQNFPFQYLLAFRFHDNINHTNIGNLGNKAGDKNLNWSRWLTKCVTSNTTPGWLETVSCQPSPQGQFSDRSSTFTYANPCHPFFFEPWISLHFLIQNIPMKQGYPSQPGRIFPLTLLVGKFKVIPLLALRTLRNFKNKN